MTCYGFCSVRALLHAAINTRNTTKSRLQQQHLSRPHWCLHCIEKPLRITDRPVMDKQVQLHPEWTLLSATPAPHSGSLPRRPLRPTWPGRLMLVAVATVVEAAQLDFHWTRSRQDSLLRRLPGYWTTNRGVRALHGSNPAWPGRPMPASRGEKCKEVVLAGRWGRIAPRPEC
jgi:hypothetical protein